MQMKNLEIEMNEKMVECFNGQELAKLATGEAHITIGGAAKVAIFRAMDKIAAKDAVISELQEREAFTPHEEASKVMREAKDRLKASVACIAGAASPIQASEYITGMASGFMAISITERNGDLECVAEFATAEDYKVWKSLNP